MTKNQLDLAALLHEHLSGLHAQELTTAITQFYRSPGSSGYHAATNLVAARLRQHGISQIEVTRYPLDGETVFAEQTMPLAWEPYDAKVRIVAPTQEDLVDFDTAPSCLAPWSTPTLPGGQTLDLIDVGAGTSDADFADKELHGNAVFIHHTEHRAAWVHAATQALQRGASGILTDYLLYQTPPFRTRESLPDAVQLLRLPNRTGEYNAWACAVDHHAGQQLRRLLRLGPVRIHADIHCRTFVGEGQNLLATIPGRDLPDEAVLFIAHTSAATKPAANCAAGPALMVEIARTLQYFIDTGLIDRPRRSIQFLFVSEGLGSQAYIHANRERLSQIKTAFCLDSVGHEQEACHSVLLFYRHPDSSPSFINDYFAGVMRRAPKDGDWVFAADRSLSSVNFQQAPYTPWSDNHYWAAYGVPSPLIMSWPDRYFHTQLLTADKTDPRVFRTAGITTALAAYEIADAGESQATLMVNDVFARSQTRLDDRTNDAIRSLVTAHATSTSEQLALIAQRATAELRYLSERDGAALASVWTLVADEDAPVLRARIDLCRELLTSAADAACERIDEALAATGNVSG